MDLFVRRPVVAVALEGAAVQGGRVEGHHGAVRGGWREELCGGSLALEESHLFFFFFCSDDLFDEVFWVRVVREGDAIKAMREEIDVTIAHTHERCSMLC